MDGLRIARELAVWFQHSFGKQGSSFKPGPFVALQDPSFQLRDLHTQIEQLKSQLQGASEQAESSQQLAELVAKEKEEYAVLAEQMDAEARTFEQVALEHERALASQKAALTAPARPIARVPTGIPAGIWAIERSESIPLNALDCTGTPSTGTSVLAAVIPGRWAAPPAPAIMTSSPRSAADPA